MTVDTLLEVAIPAHSTPTDTSASWDGPKAVADAPNSAEILRYMHAGFRGGDREAKTNYAIPHHKPRQGAAANISGVNNGLARLSQTNIDGKPGIERHLRKHRRDAGLEEAMEGREIRDAVAAVVETDELDEAEADRLLGAVVRRELEVREAQVVETGVEPLSEGALTGEGTAMIKLIAPGWGSSGYYGRDLLRRDGPLIFTEGLHMFWDHATPTEDAERPEGSLRNLAAVLTENAQWQDEGPRGPGLYAPAKIFEHFREPASELAPHIGVSIRAWGRSEEGEAEGKRGRIITELIAARSVDFVTLAGAGGEIVQLFEAAKPREGSDRPRKLEEARNAAEWLEARLHLAFTEIADFLFGQGFVTREERKALSAGIGAALDAFRGVVEEQAPGLMDRDPYDGPSDGMTATEETEPSKEGEMGNETKEAQELEEAKAAAERERDEAKREADRMAERLLQRDARDRIDELFSFDKQLSDRARRRVVETVLGTKESPREAPSTDDGKLDTTKLDEAVDRAYREEVDYLAEMTGSGNVRGMGGTGGDPTNEKTEEPKEDDLGSLFEAFGLPAEQKSA